MSKIADTTKDVLRPIIESAYSKSDAVRQLGWPINGNSFTTLVNLAEKYDIEFLSLDPYKMHRKYKTVTKICPVCGDKFTDREGHPREKATCSHSCSNTYFRSGENSGTYASGKFSFRNMGRSPKCVDCGESRRYMLRCHHIDGDTNNNDLDNREIVCNNHHASRHLKYDNTTGEWNFCTSALTPRHLLPRFV